MALKQLIAVAEQLIIKSNFQQLKHLLQLLLSN